MLMLPRLHRGAAIKLINIGKRSIGRKRLIATMVARSEALWPESSS